MEIEQERNGARSDGIHFGYQLFPTMQLELATGATDGIYVSNYFEIGIMEIHSDRIFPLNGEHGMVRKLDFFSVPFVQQTGYAFLVVLLTGSKQEQDEYIEYFFHIVNVYRSFALLRMTR